jgi:cobalt-zinc-cadmium efflux system protein
LTRLEHQHSHGEPCADGHRPEGLRHGPPLRAASGRALWSALTILAFFFVVEIAGGVLTNSLALISDAFHLLTDVAAIGLALFAQWFGRKPASAVRSFGYRRVEILAALANGFTLVAVAIFIAVEAWQRLQQPPAVRGLPMMLVAVAGLLAQVAATVVLSRAARESLNVRGAYLHALTDAVQSLGVVAAGAVILLTGWVLVDPLVSVLIAVMVAWSGGKIVVEATHVLIEGTPKELDLAHIVSLIQTEPGVRRVTDLHAWSLTSGYNFLSAHVEASPTPEDAGHDELRRRITASLCAAFPLQHVTLQIEESCELCSGANCSSWLEGGSSKSD